MAPPRRLVLALALLSLACRSSIEPPPEVHAAQGIMVGEVTATSALVQVRLTAGMGTVDGDVPGAPGVVEFTLSPDDATASPLVQSASAGPERDHIARTAFTALEPGTVYVCTTRIGSTPDTLRAGPDKTLWGAEQKAWLKKTLSGSDATYKLLISATPMVGPDDLRKKDNHTNVGGFRHEGDELFAWLRETGLHERGFFIICGDRHWQYHSIHPAGIEEFSSGALVDANSRLGRKPGDPKSTDPEGFIDQMKRRLATRVVARWPHRTSTRSEAQRVKEASRHGTCWHGPGEAGKSNRDHHRGRGANREEAANGARAAAAVLHRSSEGEDPRGSLDHQ